MRLCLFLFFSTVVYALTRIVEPDFEGVNFAKALFGKRLDKVFQETAVDSETSCQVQCLKNVRCLSYNLGTKHEKGKFICQLCDSDRFTSHENFTQDKRWLYRGMEVNNWRSRKKSYLFLLPCNSFFPPRKQIRALVFRLHRVTVHDLLVSMGRMTVSSSKRRREVQIRRVKLIPQIFWSIDTCSLPVFCCMWKQSGCESKNFTCGEKGISIPDYHRKSFKCKCRLG